MNAPRGVDQHEAQAHGCHRHSRGTRLLAVSEIQQALRDLRTETPSPSRTSAGIGQFSTSAGERLAAGNVIDRPSSLHSSSLRPPNDLSAKAALGSDWVIVIAANGGAGASTVALSLGDAAGKASGGVDLVESASPSRSGFAAVATAELGVDRTREWRRGTRGQLTVHRPIAGEPPLHWPDGLGDGTRLSVIDLGVPDEHALDRVAASVARVVLVCRPSVSGVRSAEYALAGVSAQPVVLVVVGSARWPREVSASLGPLVRDLRQSGDVVTVPWDRRLETTGLTAAPLPRPVRRAGEALLEVLESCRPVIPVHDSALPLKGTFG